ncbi:MAG: Uma2 family endonuclease [Myxococcales bacterium]
MTPQPLLCEESPSIDERWELLDGENMPETHLHRDRSELLASVLAESAAQRSALVVRNLALRWDPSHPKVGVDPDVALIEPAPPEGKDVRSVLTWTPGHVAPRVAVEIVSTTDPRKDYVIAPTKYAACGVRELWIFDPNLDGPKEGGGPYVLQIWRMVGRGNTRAFRRVYAGGGPGFSREMAAWLVFLGGHLRLAEDRAGAKLWPTEAETAHAQAKADRKRAKADRKRAKAADARAEAESALANTERERANTERERAEAADARADTADARAEAALRRIAELEAALSLKP